MKPDERDEDNLVPLAPDPLDDDTAIDALSAEEYNEFTYGNEDDDDF
ncbi:MAG: hypothetical protein JHD05_00795 [Thermoleophilia bacterium]|nr:hypothetical protein [Thermoleophilia bacterium]MBJ7333145.1 hypothetical protein [Thermoleophilia bacterium]